MHHGQRPQDGPAFERPPACTLRQASLWVLRRRLRYRVHGSSMEPTLHSGQSVLINPRAYKNKPPDRGEVILLQLPGSDPAQVIVKRVHAVSDESVVVRGDHTAASTDSRHFGPVPHALILGQVVCTFP